MKAAVGDDKSDGKFSVMADIVVTGARSYPRELFRDMKYAWRGLIKSPGFAWVGIISIGLGIGLTTMVYSLKWQLIFRALPSAANAERLVMPEKPVSYYYVEQYREQHSLFAGVAALKTGVPFNVTFQDENAKPERVYGQLVSADYFSVLGVQPQQGRTFDPELDKPGNLPVVVISDRFWRNRLNSATGVVGQTLRLNGQLATIVGITPKNFNGALSINPSELFVPITVSSAVAPELANDVLRQRNAQEFLAVICLAPGIAVESAEAALDTITRHIEEQESSSLVRSDKGRRVTLLSAGTMVPLPRKLKLVVGGFYLVLMGLIMTIACMNLANMLLARGAHRRKELAIRLAVGASRFRLVRQMVCEGILLALLGGVAGFSLAYFLSKVNSHYTLPTAVPTESSSILDWRAALFALTLAVVSGIGFSILPALRATKGDVTPSLKEGSAVQLPGHMRLGLRNLLMVAQITGSLMLLLVTGFLVMGITKASAIQTNFDPHMMYLLSMDPVRNGYTPEQAQALFEKLPDRLRSVVAVSSVTLAAQPPFAIEDEDGKVPLTSEDSNGSSRTQISAMEESIGAGYFAALNEPILAGREFTELDQRTSGDGSQTLAVVLNEKAARGFVENANVIGQRIKDDRQSYEVVGVARDLKNGIGIAQPVIYLPLTQRNFARPPADGMTIMVRSGAGVDALGGIRNEIALIDPKLTLFNVRTLSGYLELTRSYQRAAISTYGGIGVFGLLLAAIGLAGVTAYAVAQRKKEIGIRMALGAQKSQVLLLVLREGAVLIAAGSVLGLLGAFALAKTLSALTSVFVDALKVGTNDLGLLLGAPLLLAGLALLACYVPARRASGVDPLDALREG